MTERDYLASTNPQSLLSFLCDGPHRPSNRKLRLILCAAVRSIWHRPIADHHREAVYAGEGFADSIIGEERMYDYWVRAEHEYRTHGPIKEAATSCASSHLTNSRTMIHLSLEKIVGCFPEEKSRQADIIREIVGNPFQPRLSIEVVTVGPCRTCDGLGWRNEMGPNTFSVTCWQCGGEGTFAYPDRVAWLTPTVLDIAEAAYTTRDYDRLPILADALEDAGCGKIPCPAMKDWEHLKDGALWPWCVNEPPCEDGWIDHPIVSHLRGPGLHARGCLALDVILGKE